eukprot:s3379_g14.t1
MAETHGTCRTSELHGHSDASAECGNGVSRKDLVRKRNAQKGRALGGFLQGKSLLENIRRHHQLAQLSELRLLTRPLSHRAR